jgi:hypothetical protein
MQWLPENVSLLARVRTLSTHDKSAYARSFLCAAQYPRCDTVSAFAIACIGIRVHTESAPKSWPKISSNPWVSGCILLPTPLEGIDNHVVATEHKEGGG